MSVNSQTYICLENSLTGAGVSQVEMSQYIDLAIPVMITIFVAKLVADFLSKPLFMYQLDAKLMPFLAQEPRVVVHNDM